jgi:hypothetical protein
VRALGAVTGAAPCLQDNRLGALDLEAEAPSADRSLPRSTAAIGELVRGLDELLRDRPSDDLVNQVHWLQGGSA